MALDGAFLHTVKAELEPYIGGRIDKIYQPSRDEIILVLRAKAGNVRVLMNASASGARVHITRAEVENPKQPPMFCMLLRKHLGGGKLTAVRQDGLERILYFDFLCMNELGDMVTVTLACEIMGRCSNLILISQEGRVIDSIKRVDESMSRERMVLPGMTYTLPPRESRCCLLTAEKEDMLSSLDSVRNGEASKCLVKAFEGISPIFAREAVSYACRGMEKSRDELTGEERDRLAFFLKNARDGLNTGKNTFTAVMDRERSMKDFSFVPVHQYGALMVTREFPSACALLDFFYQERDEVNRMKQRSHDLLKFLASASDRISRKLALQREELETCKKRDELKIKGDLLSANLYRLEKGPESVELENFHSESLELITIELSPRLTPSQNAQRYYAEYRKAQTAEKKLTALIAQGEEELRYLDSVFDALTRSQSDGEVLELKMELAEQGYLRASKLKQKPPKAQPPLEYHSSDGFVILCGRNNKQNDRLTLKTAEKDDIWLHTQNITGSHVIIQCGGKVPPSRTIEEAAVIAAYNSKARSSSQVPVDYTQVRYVKKPAGAKPGMVIFTNNQTAYVTPDLERIQALKP